MKLRMSQAEIPNHLRKFFRPVGPKNKDLIGIPWRVAFALQADGWYLRSDIIWHKPNPMPESVTDRPTKAHEYVFLLSKRERYFYDVGATREGLSLDTHARGKNGSMVQDRARFGNIHIPGASRTGVMTDNPSGRNARSVWTIATKPTKDAHFAVMPTTLADRCIRAGSAIGDTILDPFCGAGTTGVVARRLDRSFVGIELNPRYLELARRRIDRALRPVSKLDPKAVVPAVGQMEFFA